MHLYQLSTNKNSFGKIIDLIFTTKYVDTFVFNTEQHEQLTYNSLAHNSQSLVLKIRTNEECDIATRTILRTHLPNCKSELQSTIFEICAEDDMLYGEPEYVIGTINNITNKLVQILDNNTTTKSDKILGWAAKHPWLAGNKQYLKLLTVKTRAKRMKNISNTVDNISAYKLACKNLRALYNQLRINYYKKVIDTSNGSSFEFYKLMSSKLKLKSRLPATMLKNDTPLVGNERIAAIAESLKSAFITHDQPFPADIEARRHQLVDIFNINYSNQHDELWAGYIDEFTIDEIHSAIKKLKLRKDPGPMRISAEYIKYNCLIIAPLLRNMFNVIMQSGYIPNDWKRSYIIPIPKKGNVNDVSNYRGIVSQSCIPKMFDMLITDKLRKHIGPLIVAQQHGFMPGRSTTTNLVEHTLHMREAFASKAQLDTIYVDMSKAFDRMSHRTLASKLAAASLPLPFYLAIMEFVIHRTYILKIDGKATEFSITPHCSVPQGSHAGPLLYIFYVNDAPKQVDGVNMLMYADDTKLSKIIKSREDAITLQTAYNKFNAWAESMQLSINRDKTAVLSYAANKAIASNYYHHIEHLSRVNCIKDLGVLFEQKGSINPHIESVLKRCRCMSGVLSRFTKETNSKVLAKQIFSTYIAPIIEYASPLLDISYVHKSKLNRIHKVATRIALKLPRDHRHLRYTPYATRCLMLKQLPPSDRIQLNSANFLINLVKSDQHIEAVNVAKSFLNAPSANTRNPAMFHLPRTMPNNHVFKKTALWINKHHRIIKTSMSKNQIMNKLKKELTATIHDRNY